MLLKMEEAAYYNAAAKAVHGVYQRLASLRAKHRTWIEAWRALTESAGGGVSPENEWKKLEERGVALVLADDPAFPALLREMAQPPFGLYVRGTLPSEKKLAIAIVGTRKATEKGRELARRFSRELSRAGAAIISGLALGIDAAAHEGCLEAGGETVAVLGNGLHGFYPESNAKLAEKILASGGAVISEYPLGTPSLPHHFLERNRIVSGISRGVLLVEAPERSGALVTARLAAEQGRDVFVLPGPVDHPNYRGSHGLIRDGAELVTGPEDILFALDFALDPALFSKGGGANAPDAKFNKSELAVLEILKKLGRPVTMQEILEMSGLKVAAASQTVSFLIIKNIIKETGLGYTI